MERIKLIKLPHILNLYTNQVYNSFFIEKKRLTIHKKGSLQSQWQMKKELQEIIEKLKPFEKELQIKNNQNSVEISL